jgi:hypothetical protein
MFNQKKVVGLLVVITLMFALSLNISAYARIKIATGNLTSAQRTDVGSAISFWNNYSATKDYIRFIADSSINTSQRQDGHCTFAFLNMPTSTSWAGYIDANGDIDINLTKANTPFRKLTIMKHELGHLLTLGHHLANTTSLMNASIPTNWSGISTTEQNYLKSVYGAFYGTSWGITIRLNNLYSSCYDDPGRLGY